uniref:CPG4 domain-containing protein n=1 Tax=Globodera pallida TaxID=36090 RepID=A0A183BI44_GLOPA
MAINNTFKLRPKRKGQGQLLRLPSPANPCLLKCKDDYMMSTDHSLPAPNWRLDSAIGSPLHALVETATDANAIERIDFECRHPFCSLLIWLITVYFSYHAQFLSCLEKCGTSPATQILTEGQETLKTVCQSFKKDKEFAGFVLPCLARNGAKIGKSCQLHWSLLEKDVFEALQSKIETEAKQNGQPLDDGIRNLCRGLNSYADCHLRTVAQLCHRRALSFFVRLNANSSAALLRLLVVWAGFDLHSAAQKWPECTQWNLDVPLSDGGQIMPLFNLIIVFCLFFILFS